jgi:hypothetical protein
MAVDGDKDEYIQAAVNAFERAKTLLQKICRPSRIPGMVFLGETITAARCLESYLCQSLTRIENSYLESWNGSRDTVGTALATDRKSLNYILIVSQIMPSS